MKNVMRESNQTNGCSIERQNGAGTLTSGLNNIGSEPKEKRLEGKNMDERHKSAGGIAVSLQIDTAQLDEAIAKANQLVQLLERADTLAYRISKDVGKPTSLFDTTKALK